jgi:hypothetical protein
MRRDVRIYTACLLPVILAAALAACVKTEKEEEHMEVMSATENSVKILAGILAHPLPLARAHCEQFNKQAFFKDSEPVGDQFEVLTRGSRPYIYTYDCF